MLFRHELKKQTGISLTIVLFILCFLLCFITAYRREAGEAENEPASGKILAGVFRLYAEDPGQITDYLTELQEYRRIRVKAEKEAKAAGTEFIETRQSRWTDGLYTEDIRIINYVIKSSEKTASFTGEIDKVILNTELNAAEFLRTGYSEDSFEVRYQRRAGRLYEKVRDSVSLHDAYVSGWDTLYGFSLSGILSAFIALLIGVTVFSYEHETGMILLLRSAKRGRGRTALAKIAASFILSAATAVLLTLGSAAAIAAAGGFYGGNEPLQALDDFRKSALLCSVREYLLLFLGQRVLAALAFSSVSLLFSGLFLNNILAFASSFAIAGINFLMYSSAKGKKLSAAGCINLCALSDGSRLFYRFNACDLFGSPVSFTACCLTVTFSAGVASVILATLFWSLKKGVAEFSPLKKLKKELTALFSRLRRAIPEKLAVGDRQASVSFAKRTRSLSLTRGELFKFISSSVAGALSLLLLLAGPIAYFRSIASDARPGYSETLYYMLIERYRGDWTREKQDEIDEIYDESSRILKEFHTLSQQFSDGLITRDEYNAAEAEYVDASRDRSAIQAFYDRSVYLKTLYEETGTVGVFLDDRGWNRFLERGTQWMLYASVLIALAPAVAVEFYGQGFFKLMHSTKKGRHRVFFTKLAMTAALGILFPIFCETSQLLITACEAGLDLGSAPVRSLPTVSWMTADMSVSGYVALYIAVRALACLALSLLVFGLSGAFRKVFPALATAAAATLFPALLEFSGVAAAGRLDFLRLFGAGVIIRDSVLNGSGSGFMLLTVCLAVSAVVASVPVFISYRRFCR